MKSYTCISVAAFTLAAALGDEPKASVLTQQDVLGSWKLVSVKIDGKAVTQPRGTTTIKHVTPSQFMWTTYDASGTMTVAGGGGYDLKSDKYVETPEYGMGGDFPLLKGKKQVFTGKVESGKWHHRGKLSSGLHIEELWEKVE